MNKLPDLGRGHSLSLKFYTFLKTWINHNQTCIVVFWWSIKLQPKNCHNSTDFSATKRGSEGQSNSWTGIVSTLKLQNHVYSFNFKVRFTKYWRHDEADGYYIPQNVTNLWQSSNSTHRQRLVSAFSIMWIVLSQMWPRQQPDATSGNPGQRWESSSAEFTCLLPAALVQRVPVRLRIPPFPPPPTQMWRQRHKHTFMRSTIEAADFHMTKLKKQWLVGVRLRWGPGFL